MAYIGRTTDGFGVRQRFLFTPDAGATSVSGTDASGATLTFSDSVYMDVFLNGVLLKAGTDYNTNTANTIAGLTATVANDEVTVLVYDIFTTADMVSATSGGTFTGNVTHSGTVTVDDTTDSTSTTTGSIQTDGGLGVAKDLVVGDDVLLKSDAAVVKFGADSDVTLTHVADTGLLLNSTMALQFNDASQSINAPSATVLDINATDEIELNATAVDLNGTLDVSGTLAVAGLTTVSNAIQFNEVVKPSAGEAAIFRRNTDDNLYIQAADSGGSDKGVLILDGGQNTLAMFESSGINLVGDIDIETGDIFFSGSGKGINLGVTSNTDSNTLDDYEEGTFTPTLHYQNTSGLTLSYDSQSGTYTKIGRMVHVYISLQADISGSLVNDNIAFRGLPFNVSVNGGSTGSVVNITNATGSGVDKTFTLQPYAADYLYISNAQGNGNYADDVGTGSNVLFQVATWYIAS